MEDSVKKVLSRVNGNATVSILLKRYLELIQKEEELVSYKFDSQQKKKEG
jgi:hypothetical protein